MWSGTLIMGGKRKARLYGAGFTASYGELDLYACILEEFGVMYLRRLDFKGEPSNDAILSFSNPLSRYPERKGVMLGCK